MPAHQRIHSKWPAPARSDLGPPRRSWTYMQTPATRRPFVWSKITAVDLVLRRGTLPATKQTSSFAMSPAVLVCRSASGPARQPARSTYQRVALSASAPPRPQQNCTSMMPPLLSMVELVISALLTQLILRSICSWVTTPLWARMEVAGCKPARRELALVHCYLTPTAATSVSARPRPLLCCQSTGPPTSLEVDRGMSSQTSA